MVDFLSAAAGMPDVVDVCTNNGLRALSSVQLHQPFTGLERMMINMTLAAMVAGGRK